MKSSISIKTKLYAMLIVGWAAIFNLQTAFAYPIYAQQAYENPREPNGRIVCANCHLAQKPVNFESPKAVLPDQVFETVVNIPYDLKAKQILGNGQKGALNVGAVMILPEGFKLAPKEKLDSALKNKVKGLYITPYSPSKDNILVIGPISGDKYQDITFPLIAPNPETNPKTSFIKYPIYVGANRGRGQVYPTGEKTNNNVLTAELTGKIQDIVASEKGDQNIEILSNTGTSKTQIIPKGLELIVTKGQTVQKDQPLTNNPNVGGFGQVETEIVLQSPGRIIGFLLFCLSTILTQTFFVLKKKQFEKVQAIELKKN